MTPPKPNEFVSILEETLSRNGIDYHKFINEIGQVKASEDRKSGKVFSFSEHLRGLVYAQLSNQRPWGPIADHVANIDEIFFDFDPDRLQSTPPEYFSDSLKEIRCGNRQINKQMVVLSENINTFKRIVANHGSLDAFLEKEDAMAIATALSYPGTYKLKQIGLALALEYLKNVGIEAIKPDVHIMRILSSSRLGYLKDNSDEYEAIIEVLALAEEAQSNAIYLDNLLWLLGAQNYGNICKKDPSCNLCGFIEICNYPKK
ncbi:MAG: hypothetical protein BGO78_14370 [Chloroflexi bacterium 44-23]|nr:MAG: hypothetical protein BGO78_14370 [Chloroflexi bacterium 44-23]